MLTVKQDLHIPPWVIDVILRINEQPEDKRLLILIGGVRNLGKTTAIIQIIRHLASLQKANSDGERIVNAMLVRESYRQLDQLIQSFSEWFDVRDEYKSIERGGQLGMAYKSLKQEPKIILAEKTPDYINFIRGTDSPWDGTTTKTIFTCFSYNKPSSDGNIRGSNFHHGWLNEIQTLPEKSIETAQGSFGRPEGSVVNPILLMDYNLPGSKDIGYEHIKRTIALSSMGDADIYIVPMEAPYTFRKEIGGDFIFEGKTGFLEENPSFPEFAPHLNGLDAYKHFLGKPDDTIRRELLGMVGRATDGNLLYTEFETETHVKEVPVPVYEDYPLNYIIIGLDFGYNPSCLFSYFDGLTLNIFHEISIENINFFELLKSEIIPYLKAMLPKYYAHDKIAIVADPHSGGRREAIKSATPIGVLLGQTDVNGDEDGDADRYDFSKVYPSPCGNSWDHRMSVSQLMLTKPHGVAIDKKRCPTLIRMFEESCVGANGGKPLKKAHDPLHGMYDTFQYVCAFLSAGFDYKAKSKTKQKKKRTAKRKTYR